MLLAFALTFPLLPRFALPVLAAAGRLLFEFVLLCLPGMTLALPDPFGSCMLRGLAGVIAFELPVLRESFFRAPSGCGVVMTRLPPDLDEPGPAGFNGPTALVLSDIEELFSLTPPVFGSAAGLGPMTVAPPGCTALVPLVSSGFTGATPFVLPDFEESFVAGPPVPTGTLIPPTLIAETTGRTGLIGTLTATVFVEPAGVITFWPTCTRFASEPATRL